MFALHLLGGAVLEGPGGLVTGRAAHRRRLALLAVLSVARGRPVGRERVIGLLWPDHRTDSARHLLSESLYVLRKELGEDAFVSSGDDVGLNTAGVRCDVAEFDRAVEEGSLEEAARLYRGPFLDGFYVSDAPEFERWAEGERDRLARQMARALECLAEAAEGAGRPSQAVEWWRRLAVHDPYNSRVGIRLMQALDDAGERAAALWFAETHVGLLREELGVEPDADFAALVERLRSGPVRVPAPEPALAPPSPSPSSADSADAAPGPDAADPARSAAAPTAAEADASAPLDAPAVPSVPLSPAAVAQGSAPEPVVVQHAAPSAPPAVQVVAPSVATGQGAADAAPAAESAVEAGAAADASPRAEPVPSAAAADASPRAGAFPSSRGPDGAEPALAGAEMVPSRARDARSSARQSGRGGWGCRVARAWARPAAAVGVVLGLAAAALTGGVPARPEPSAPAGFDPRRIAVLYFDDYSRGEELGYLANGLTESLIHALSQVEALEVISRNGVKPYHHRTVLFDSMVADLRVGTVVEGSVQRAGDSVRVTVQLIDANTQAHLESRTVTYPLAGGIAMEDSLAAEVSGFLRQRLGREIALRETRLETRSAAAWQAVLQAQQASDDARRLGAAAHARDAASADRLLARADSLLGLAQRADPGWSRPALLRGWVHFQRGRMADDARGPALIRAALREADAVLAREPGNARALELRGTVRLRLVVSASDSAGQAREMERAEQDLRAAVAADPGLASAWNTLSALLRVRGNLAESELAGRRALQEDAYLAEASDILHRLALISMVRGDFAQARSLCDQGRRRAPDDWRFLECRLVLLRDDGSQAPDPALARALAGELERVYPSAQARADGRAYTPAYRLALQAAVLARAGQADSARAVLARAQRAVGSDSALRLSLMYDEAIVRSLMGDQDRARALLREVLARRPTLRAFAERDPLLRTLFAAGPT